VKRLESSSGDTSKRSAFWPVRSATRLEEFGDASAGTRDRAYIGPVMVPFLIAAGHAVVGLDASGTTAVISVRHRMSTNNELAALGMPRLMILSA
jgi:hypothetical protein